MTTRPPVKAPITRQIVGVIASRADLLRAVRIKNPPGLFELRLDHLLHQLDFVENKLSTLPAPFIVTARHPRECGANNLSVNQRRQLLSRFLRRARYVDVELRSARALESVLSFARKQIVGRIISFHDFNSTPTVVSLRAKARAAKSLGADIFKVATRTDSKTDLARLLEFFTGHDVDLPISAMGIGKLGRESRRELLRLGSVLNYANLGRVQVRGQPSLSEITRWTLAERR
jgi:3-dehydroquinate dehydratase type I